MSLQSWFWTSCFTYSTEPANFPYVSPFQINRHSSRAFGDAVWCVVASVTYIVLVFFWEKKIVQRMQQVVAQYEDRLRKTQSLPKFSYGRGMLRKDGAPNRIFVKYLFGHQELAIQFLKDVGLIRSKVQCNICEREITWSADPHCAEGFRWRRRKRVARVRCRGTASIRHGSSWVISLSWKLYLLRTSCAATQPTKSKKNLASVTIRSLIGACSAGKPCSSSWRAALKKSVVLIKSSKLTAAKSVGLSTLFRVSGCLAVPYEDPAEHFLFPSRTEPPTPWRLFYVNGSNQARRSSAIAGVRIAISTPWVTRTAPSTVPYTSSIQILGTTPTPSSPRGIASRLPGTVRQGRVFPLPSRSLHVLGEVQGTRNATFPTIPAYRREHRLVPCSINSLLRPRHVMLLPYSPPHIRISANRYGAAQYWSSLDWTLRLFF